MNPTKSVQLRFFLLISLALTVYASGTHGQDVRATPGPLRKLTQVTDSLRISEVRFLDFDVEATITFWEPARHKLFVQDESVAIFAKLAANQYEKRLDLRVGSRVRMVGQVDTKHGFIVVDHLEVLSQASPPNPFQVELDKMAKGAFWSLRVKMDGVVESVVLSRERTEITIAVNDRRAVCNCLGPYPPSKTSMVGARIRVVGVMDWETHESGSPSTAVCHVANFDDIEVLSSLERIDSLTSVETLRTACGVATGKRISCNGIVTFIGEGEFLLEDEGGSLLIRHLGNSIIVPSAQLKVEGCIQRDSSGVYLQLEKSTTSNVVRTSRGVIRTNAKEIASDELNRCRVSVLGKLADFYSTSDSRTLTLKDQGITYKVYFKTTDERFEELKLRVGQEIQCQGLLTHVPANEDAWFAVRLKSVDDLWSSDAGIRISQEEILWWLAVCSTLLLLAVVWSTTLRMQVKRKTRNLANLTTRLNASYEAIDEGILVYSPNDVLSCNRQFGELTGLPLSTGSPIDTLSRHIKSKFHIDGDETLFEPERVSSPTTVQLRSLTEPRRQLVAYLAPVQDSKGDSNATLLALNDVTKQKELEAALLQSQKMEAVGQLAGGIAHDFNNLLMVIISNLDLARYSSPADAFEWGETLDAANRAADRAGELVKQLLGFSRLSALEIQTASLNPIAANVASLIRRSFESTVRIETELDPRLQPAKVDAAQIEQVLMNICLNARDALKNDAGCIRISSSNFSSAEGDFVKISVEDDGVGMSQNVASRMFEPFYTTKETEDGTGLGMSMSYGIVSQHGGWIECDSKPGTGTRIDVILPRSDEEEKTKGVHIVIDSPSANEKQTGRVLVIDDDDAVRRATCGLLVSMGFDVDDVDNGVDGLQMLADDAYDLLVLDLNMPVLSGRDVCAKLAESQPQLPVIVCTGYLTDNLTNNCSTNGQTVSVLQKPFRVDDLKIVVAETLATGLAS